MCGGERGGETKAGHRRGSVFLLFLVHALGLVSRLWSRNLQNVNECESVRMDLTCCSRSSSGVEGCCVADS